ncbi:hypothetical protein LO762_21800 [Actinocorallia sp. API 0066]|uniref:hypothetical protein n=1 Tax=Actinocorallia sp. API 0066 TaxID=2896846 RepID=UPI001E375AEC|nr:hypothetical protein [Actinocorallia sp. API 0066]MCD0451808.1 hypothetical protein [Actinocorallia sp. API 0066]
MDETFVLPVPAELHAVCLVAAPTWLPPGLGARALELVEVVGPDVPPLPWLTGPGAECARCAPCGLEVDSVPLRRIRAAEFHLRVSAVGGAGWPPDHVIRAAALARELADETGGILIDAATGDVDPWAGPPEPFDVPEGFAAAEWLGVRAAREGGGRGWRLTTAGLTVFGLPEVRVRRVPEHLRAPWHDVLAGVAQRLLRDQWADLARAPASAFREIPARLTLTAADVGAATAGCPHGTGTAPLALRLDPGRPGGPPTFLTVTAPPSAQGPAPPWRTHVITALRR